jgi:hypothetical protein
LPYAPALERPGYHADQNQGGYPHERREDWNKGRRDEADQTAE